MAELILHHYWESPYAEKIRRVMGMKGLAWRSVIIPMVMPKPDLTALTGGYRKTPVLQIGADVYCDTDLIARTIDRLHPEPPLFPDASGPLCLMLGAWQQELFWLAVREVGVRAPIFPPGFLEDRSAMVEGGLSLERVLADAAPQRAQLRARLERIEAFGHGTFTEMQGAEAVEVAQQATPAARRAHDPSEPNGLRPGDRVEIVHESFGQDPVTGELVASSVHEIAIAREDARAGDVVVHLPREHYKVRRV